MVLFFLKDSKQTNLTRLKSKDKQRFKFEGQLTEEGVEILQKIGNIIFEKIF